MSDDRWAEEIRATIAELSSENRRLKDAMANRTEERADFKSEVLRLRAELAAEKERAAGVAENFRESWPYGRLIAAAIRASPAAPPQTEDRYHLRPEPADLDHFNREHYRREDAAPPHVEPSAAESARGPLVLNPTEGRLAVDAALVAMGHIKPPRYLDGARMLELAREIMATSWSTNTEELAALVIETFGEKK